MLDQIFNKFSDNTEKDRRLKRAVGVCKGAVGAFSNSWKKKRDMAKLQETYGPPKHNLVMECQTRWGSRCKMISRFMEQRRPVSDVLEKDPKTKHLIPTWQDVDVLESVLKALQPLYDFTDALSGEQYVSVSCVKPVLHLFREDLLKEAEDSTQLTNDLRKKIMSYMDEKYGGISVNNILDMAGLCDPRFKLQYIEEERSNDIKNKIIDEMNTLTLPGTSDATSQSQTNPEIEEVSAGAPTAPLSKKPRKSLGSMLKRKSSHDGPRSAEAELQAFLDYPMADEENCPLDWWKSNAKHFPRLGMVAKKYLCIPATSAPSERVFSTAGNIVTPKRSRLNPSKVDKLVFLAHNKL